MEQRRPATLLFGILCLATLKLAASGTWKVSHSFHGSTFLPAGKLVGDIPSDSELSWQRPDLNSEDMDSLEAAVVSNGLYSLRVETDKGTLLTSVPATCLKSSPLVEKLEIHVDRNGHVSSLNYHIPSCTALIGSSSSSSHVSGDGDSNSSKRPTRLPVRMLLPSTGPELRMPEFVGEFADVLLDSVDGGAMGAAALDPNAKPRAALTAGRKGGPPPPDDRTWLQKNWLFLLAAGMMIMNMVAKANAPQQQAPGGGAPAAGAARRG